MRILLSPLLPKFSLPICYFRLVNFSGLKATMDEECLILGTFEKNNKVDDTINIFSEDNDTQGESKKIKNPSKGKKQKRNSSVEGEGEKKKKKKKKTVGLDENKELPPNSNFSISKTYTIAESDYSISETEIHHLASGISMVNRGTNTEAQPNVRSDNTITCCCVNGHQSQSGLQVSNDSHSIRMGNTYSCEILDLSNGLVLNELQNMRQRKTMRNLKPYVPDGYIDLKGKGNKWVVLLSID